MVKWDKQKIAMDFDDTFTLAPDVWSRVIDTLILDGNFDVCFVTFRFQNGPNEDINFWAERLDIPVIYTEGRQKAEVCAKLGWIPDVWIDDMPILIPVKQQLQAMIIGIERNEEKQDG